VLCGNYSVGTRGKLRRVRELSSRGEKHRRGRCSVKRRWCVLMFVGRYGSAGRVMESKRGLGALTHGDGTKKWSAAECGRREDWVADFGRGKRHWRGRSGAFEDGLAVPFGLFGSGAVESAEFLDWRAGVGKLSEENSQAVRAEICEGDGFRRRKDFNGERESEAEISRRRER